MKFSHILLNPVLIEKSATVLSFELRESLFYVASSSSCALLSAFVCFPALFSPVRLIHEHTVAHEGIEWNAGIHNG